MKIGLDLDGVVYPWHDEMFRYFQENKGYAKGIGEFWLKDWHLVTEYYVSIAPLYLSTTPREDVLTYLPKLAELGEIYYITARPPDLLGVTRKFFNIYDLPFRENVIFSADKATYSRLLGIDIFLDDNTKNVESLSRVTDAYLFKCIHNRDARDGFPLINSMQEFYELVLERSQR